MSDYVKLRRGMERLIVEAAVGTLLGHGCSLGVFDTEEVTLRRSKDAAEVLKALFTTDEDWLLVWRPENNEPEGAVLEGHHLVARGRYRDVPEVDLPDEWLRLIYGNDGWDVISDYTTGLDDRGDLLRPVHTLTDALAEGRYTLTITPEPGTILPADVGPVPILLKS